MTTIQALQTLEFRPAHLPDKPIVWLCIEYPDFGNSHQGHVRAFAPPFLFHFFPTTGHLKGLVLRLVSLDSLLKIIQGSGTLCTWKLKGDW